jgi:hypothetical protein
MQEKIKRPITAPCQKRGGRANMNIKAFNKH